MARVDTTGERWPADTAGLALVRWGGYPWLVLAVSLLVQTTASFGNQSISPLAPFLVAAFDLTRAQVGLAFTAATAGGCVVLILAGRLSDRIGVRTPFLLGLVAAGVPLILAALVPSFAWLLVLMALGGVGNGLALPPTTRAIVEWFPLRRRGLAMGIKQTGVALAGVICGLLVPTLATTALGWRGTLAVLGGAMVLSGAVAWLLYRDRVPVEAPATPATPAERPGALAVLRNPNLRFLCGVTFLYAGVQLSVIGFLVLFLRERVGLSVEAAGALLALAQGGGVVGRIAWGVVSDTVFGGRRKVVMGIIGALGAISSLALSFIGSGTGVVVLWLVLAVTGVSIIGWNGINMIFVAEIAGREASATAAGMNLTASYLGAIIFPPLFGTVVDLTGGNYPLAFRLGALLSLVALVLLSRVRPKPTAR